MTDAATGQALLQAILDDPERDDIRLVYADWLEEHGDEADLLRAEFIRIQVELAQLRPGPEGRRKASNLLTRYRKGAPILLRARTPAVLLLREALLLRNSPCRDCRWHYPVPHETGWNWTYRRGFVDSINCTCDDFLRHAAAIFAAQPVQKVWLVDKQPLWSETVPPLNRWICYSHHPASYEYVLPPILFEQLLPDPNCLVVRLLPDPDSLMVRVARLDVHPGDSCDYAMPEHANAGLSRACVRLGRKLAREARRDPA